MNKIEIDYYLVQRLISLGINYKSNTITAFKMITDGSIVIKANKLKLPWLTLPNTEEDYEDSICKDWAKEYNILVK
jgi:hypothetical protein